MTEEKPKFLKGTSLSIFSNDRMEDFIALGCALLIALGVYLFV